MKRLNLIIPGGLIDIEDNLIDEKVGFSLDKSFSTPDNPQLVIESETGSVIFSINKKNARSISKFFAELSLELSE